MWNDVIIYSNARLISAPFFIRKSRYSHFFTYFCDLETNNQNIYDKKTIRKRTYVPYALHGTGR
jgi:hypothetical protein